MRGKRNDIIVLVLAALLLLTQMMPAMAEETPGAASVQIPDGIYKPDEFTFSGGTGKVKITCPQVSLQAGAATAKLVFSSPYYTKLQADGVEYAGKIDETNRTSTYEIPVVLNADMEVVATTTAMSEAHDIAYVLHIKLSASSEPIEQEKPPEDPGKDDPAGDPPGDDPAKPTKPEPEPAPAGKKLADGTYRIKAKTDERMFYLLEDEQGRPYVTLKKKGKKLTVSMTLTGTGYDYLYLGDTADAEKAKASAKIKHKAVNGYYTYTFNIPALDQQLQIAAHSAKRDAWYQHEIIFYSNGAVKIKDSAANVPDKKKEGNSSANLKVDPNGGTAAVSSATTLKDGVYQPDQFSWSGGSGRLAYIRCEKITVKSGKATATIAFSSSTYDQVRAGGRIYQRAGGGAESLFTIPVKLNANNSIAGRTSAMSQVHWVSYTIYPYLAAADADGAANGKGENVSKEKLASSAPKITGLKAVSAEKPKYAENFCLYHYADGISLLQVKTGAFGVAATQAQMDKEGSAVVQADQVEYDDDGKPIAKSQGEITEELYHHQVVSYLLVPSGVDVPAGLDKEMIIVHLPVKRTYIAAEDGANWLKALGLTDRVAASGIDGAFTAEEAVFAGDIAQPDYQTLIRQACDLAIVSSSGSDAGEIVQRLREMAAFLCDQQKLIPARFPMLTAGWLAEAATALSGEDPQAMETAYKRFATLGIPFIIDRAGAETDPRGREEWIKVYGALFGCEKQAEKQYNDKLQKLPAAAQEERTEKEGENR